MILERESSDGNRIQEQHGVLNHPKFGLAERVETNLADMIGRALRTNEMFQQSTYMF